jgi:hypothetical protein
MFDMTTFVAASLLTALQQVGAYLEYTGHQINV